jgi:hypothetical protein
MLKFTVLDDKVCVDPNIKLIEEFDNILLYGKKKKNLELSNRMLIYVFYCCDLSEDNPMRDIDFRMKPEQAMSRAFRNEKSSFTKEEQNLIDAAIDAYNFFNETSAERAILAIDKKIDEARTTLEGAQVEIIRNTNENTGVTTFASNENIIGNLAKQIGEMMTLKIQLTNAAKKLENTGRVRGGKGSSLIERSARLVRNLNDQA